MEKYFTDPGNLFLIFLVWGIVANLMKLRGCFIVWIIANIGFTYFAVEREAWFIVSQQIIYFAFNIYGLWKWRDEPWFWRKS